MELLKRVIVAVIFIPGIIAVFWLGGWWLLGFLAAVSLLAMWEVRDLFRHKGITLPGLLVPFNVLFFLAATLCGWREVFLIFFALFATVLGRDIILDRRQNALIRVAGCVFSLVYTGLFLSSIHHIRAIEGGRWLILLLLVSIWITDSMAYFVGMKFGRHRGLIKVSPKKSVEGFVAGLVFAFALPLLTAWLRPGLVSWAHAAFIGVAAGVFGQLGDLFESMLKRDAGVKDSSRLLPGHGGILDRFDSLFVAAPLLYLLLLYSG